MNALLGDLVDHQEWADAMHWRAVAVVPAAREHRDLRRRLHHIHQVQRMFVWVVGDRTVTPTPSKPADFATFEDLCAYARGSHEQIRSMVTGGRREIRSIFSPRALRPPREIVT
jgi:hypothetical protein